MTEKEKQITEDKKTVANKPKLLVMAIILSLAFLACVGASVAWVMISRTPIVSDLTLTVTTVSRLEIAPDVKGIPGEWGVQLDLSTVLENLSLLKPVTYSKTQDRFYTAGYGLDGRVDGVNVALTDESNANVISDGSITGTKDGYYIMATYWLRAPSNAIISLAEAKEVEEGKAGAGTFVVGNPVWNGSAVRHENGGHGSETAIRIGLRCQTTDLNGNPIGAPRFVIYEPNGDMHVNGTTGYIETMSMDGGTGLVPAGDLFWQTASTWNETAPVLSSDVIYNLGKFQSSPELFEIKRKTLEKITMYVWIEGNDVDCINLAAAYPTSLLANIQFTPSDNTGTGINRDTTIDPEDGYRPEETIDFGN